MRRGPGFGYAQARIQARYGLRPTEATWLQLAASQSFPAYLEAARTTTLGAWVVNLSGHSDVHDVEHCIRGVLYLAVTELAGWVPKPWAPPVLWTRWVVYLPAVRYLLEGSAVRAWMREGHRLRPFLQDSTAARAQAIEADGGGDLVRTWRRGEPLERGWLDAWRRRWPDAPAAMTSSLDHLAQLLVRHAREFADGSPAVTSLARHWLQGRLQRIFRRQAMQPAAVFAYLALLALDLERLRGDLVTRRLLT